MRKSSGFSLIELMVSIVIVGILSTTALPSYKKYIVKSKMAEAYTILDSMTKNQITYYNENTDFYYINSINPTITQPPMVIQTNAGWETIGYPAPVGSKVTFAYNSHAGKINSAGTEITAPGSSSSGNGFALRANALLSTAIQGGASVQCNVGLASNAALGAPSAANSDWALVAAIGDLDNDYTTECTVVTMLIESTTANGRKPSVPSGYLITRYGK